MRSVRDEFRRLIDTFDPKSREYWRQAGETFFRLLPEDRVQAARGVIDLLCWATGGIGGWLLREVLPLAASLWFSRRIHALIREEKQHYEIPQHAAHCLQLTKDDLKDAHKLELGRREAFTRKAQAYLMGVTLGTSFVIGIMSLAAKIQDSAHYPTAVTVVFRVIIGFIILSLFMSAIAALRVIAPSESYDVWLQERLPPGEDEEEVKKQLLKMTLLNQAYNLIAAYHLLASYAGMRNGIYLILVTLLLVLLSA